MSKKSRGHVSEDAEGTKTGRLLLDKTEIWPGTLSTGGNTHFFKNSQQNGLKYVNDCQIGIPRFLFYTGGLKVWCNFQ